MNQQERESEIRIINSHLSSVKGDLISYVYRLEEIKCRVEAKKLDAIIGKLESLQWAIEAKSQKTRR